MEKPWTEKDTVYNPLNSITEYTYVKWFLSTVHSENASGTKYSASHDLTGHG